LNIFISVQIFTSLLQHSLLGMFVVCEQWNYCLGCTVADMMTYFKCEAYLLTCDAELLQLCKLGSAVFAVYNSCRLEPSLRMVSHA